MLRTIAAAAAFSCVAVAAQASELDGLWTTPTDGGVVEIFDCGGGVCARVVDAGPLRGQPGLTDIRNKDHALRGRPLKGLLVLQGFRGGPKTWAGGKAYDPATGDAAQTATLTLVSGQILHVKGCVGPFCRTQVWRRKADAAL